MGWRECLTITQDKENLLKFTMETLLLIKALIFFCYLLMTYFMLGHKMMDLSDDTKANNNDADCIVSKT